MGVNRQQALQGGFASRQLLNVREQEAEQYKGTNGSQAAETQQYIEKRNNMAAHAVDKVSVLRVRQKGAITLWIQRKNMISVFIHPGFPLKID